MDYDVSKLCCVVAAAVQEFAIVDDAASYSCAESEKDHVVNTFAGTDGVFAPAGNICIIIKNNGLAELAA